MPHIVKFQTSLQDDSGMARDQYVTTLYRESDDAIGANEPALCNGIAAFHYGLAEYYSQVIADAGHTTKCYLVGAPLETPPFYTDEFVLPAHGAVALPNEVASCLSFRGALHPGWKRQSVYGRIYLGPLNATSMSSTSDGSHVGTAFRTAVMTAITTLAVLFNDGVGRWVVYSKLHDAATNVIEASMDNEWDTQRSRGRIATEKSIVAIAP